MVDFFKLSAQEALAETKTDLAVGLSAAEVQARQAQYGKNALPTDEGVDWVKLIVGQFTDLMVIILIIAAGISFVLGEVSDVIVILIIVILNAALGIYQEFQAEQALAALSAMQVPMVRVRRDGEVRQVSAEDIVPGDMVLLEEGDRIPADGRLIESVNLQVEEAALTGESLPVGKNVEAIASEGSVALGDRKNMVFMGTSVNYGRGEVLITETGLQTEIGNIATMLLQVEEGTTPLQRRLNQLGQVLATGALIVVILVFLVGWLIQGIPWQDMFLIAVSLAVAAVPEGLPALVTIGLSLGAARMVRRNALIRRLPAVETLGSVTTICSDKTGTLTKNEMTATFLALPGHDDVRVDGIGYTPQGDFIGEGGKPLDPHTDDTVARFLKAMALSTNAHLERIDDEGHMNVVGDTTEGALVVAAGKAGWTRDQLEKDLPRVGELPFSSERKAMTTVHQVIGEEANRLFENAPYITITKGAPDRLINWATHEHLPDKTVELAEDRRDKWQKEVDSMANQGLRVLGIAYRPIEKQPEELDDTIERGLHLLGLVGILDPARPEARESVKVAKAAGIRTVMITGDHALTAEAIARDLGILEEGQHAITGNTLDKMSEAEIKEAVKTTSCFARVSPSHKLQLVKTLQGQEQIVAMTGDGVNDAPALKQADIGVAMGITGTDVSKGAAEMVLTDDNFASIVSAVEEGRAIYDNIKKFIKYLLSSNVGEILVMFTALLVGLKLPLLAIQILWINLVTDGLPAIALGFEPAEEGVMNRKPRHKDESIFAGGTGRHIIWVGILIAILTLGGYVWGYSNHNMVAFSPTLGLEEFTREELVELVGEEFVLEGWDDFSIEKREEILEGNYENLSFDEITVVLEANQAEGETAAIPEDWDELSADERREILGESEEAAALEEESSSGILGEAEKIPRTIAFTVLAFTQMFEVMAIHAGDRVSFFRTGFKGNNLLLWAVLSTFILQMAVVYIPFLQSAFHTAALTPMEVFVTFLLGAIVLFGVEIEKLVIQREQEHEMVTTTT